jgi:hypothetical protein
MKKRIAPSPEVRDIENCCHLGANSYIKKAVDFERFSQTIQRLGEYWFHGLVLPCGDQAVRGQSEWASPKTERDSVQKPLRATVLIRATVVIVPPGCRPWARFAARIQARISRLF